MGLKAPAGGWKTGAPRPPDPLRDPDCTSVCLFIFASLFQVVDLLVAMCRAALESPRKSIIFEPYPSVVDPSDPKTLAFNPKVSVSERGQEMCETLLSGWHN